MQPKDLPKNSQLNLSKRQFRLLIPILSIMLLFSLCYSVGAVESGLLGVPIFSTPQDLLRIYGKPAGIVVPGPSGGLVMNRMLTPTEMKDIRLGLRSAPAPQSPPPWARTVLPGRLTENQQIWLYQLEKGAVSAGFIIKGKGEEAVVTDIIAAGFKSIPSVRTERGVHLGDSFTRLLLAYNYPPVIQPYGQGTQAAAGAQSAQAGRTGAGRGGAAARRTGGGGGGMPRFGAVSRSGGGGGGARPSGAGRGSVPTMGATASGNQQRGAGVVSFNQQSVAFSKNCVVLYDGLAFTLVDLKIVRIQVTQ